MRLTVTLFGIFMILLAIGCTKTDSQASAEPLALQLTTLKDMERYLVTSDWHERLKIQRANAQDELVFSRIFRAFDVIRIGKLPQDDPQEIDAAWNELFRNPALTVIALRPVLFESATKEELTAMSSMSYPPVREGNREIVFSILCRIATFEVTTNALHALDNLSQCTNTEIALRAKRSVSIAQENNWRAKKRLYQDTHSGKILHWFADNVLRRGLSRQEVNLYLGEGIETPSFIVQYRGDRLSGAPSLDLRFWDDYLINWEFEGPKPASLKQ